MSTENITIIPDITIEKSEETQLSDLIIKTKQLDLENRKKGNSSRYNEEEEKEEEEKKEEEMTMDKELSTMYGETYYMRLDFDNITHVLFMKKFDELKEKRIGSDELLQLIIENLEVEIKYLKHLISIGIHIVKGEMRKNANKLLESSLERNECLLNMYKDASEEENKNDDYKNMMNIILTYELRMLGIDYQQALVAGLIEAYKKNQNK